MKPMFLSNSRMYWIVAFIVILTLLNSPLAAEESSANAKSECIRLGGMFDATHLECSGSDSSLIGKAQSYCTKHQGSFEECASPCRHQTESSACIAMCEWVCKLDSANNQPGKSSL
jgi:hypothetical protein